MLKQIAFYGLLALTIFSGCAIAPLTATSEPSVPPTLTSAGEPEIPPTLTATTAPVVGSWTHIKPGGETTCAHGTPYSYWVRPGISGKLMIFFEGGGGCWDADTCRDTGEEFNGYYDSRVSANDDPTYRGGVLDLSNGDNPFRDDTIVYVPVCTGDVHWGSAEYTYPDSDVTIQFKGYINARAALDWAYLNAPDPASVFISGCSAGSVGSVVHAADIIEHYPDTQIAQVGDSLAFVFEAPVDLKTDWGIDKTFPAWMNLDASNFDYADYQIALANHYPDLTFANYNAQADNVQVFYTFLDPSMGDKWAILLNNQLDKIHAAAANYRSFTAGGTNHCVFIDGNFYRYAVDGFKLRDWVADIAAGQTVPTLHCAECSFAETVP